VRNVSQYNLHRITYLWYALNQRKKTNFDRDDDDDDDDDDENENGFDNDDDDNGDVPLYAVKTGVFPTYSET
jgi:hypothetical protein